MVIVFLERWCIALWGNEDRYMNVKTAIAEALPTHVPTELLNQYYKVPSALVYNAKIKKKAKETNLEYLKRLIGRDRS